jgi:mannose-1-phosphate guanylyltransferase
MNQKESEQPVVLILAGGKGERFWPRSRESTPKQLQKVYSDKTLLQETLERAYTITDPSRIFIGTNEELKKSIMKSEAIIPSENYIIEPEGKNTAPIIALASLIFQKKFGNPNQVVLSADAYVNPVKEFTKNIKEGLRYCKNHIVLLGVRPTRPETGYGYISTGKSIDACFHVNGFHEKPDHKKALKYIKKRNFFWNPGIFIWSTDYILNEFEKYAQYILNPIKSSFPHKKKSNIIQAFKQIPSEAIDTAILEKSTSILMLKTTFQWDDVGSWISLERVLEGDDDQNFHIGKKSFHYHSYGNISSVKKEMIVFLGTQDIIVVEEEDLLFIASKAGLKDIKSLLTEFRKNKDLQKYLK